MANRQNPRASTTEKPAPAARTTLATRLDRWLLRRCTPQSGRVTLGARAIYILPTRFGWMFGLILVSLYFGAVSFSSNLTHALAYLLLAVGLLDMRETHRQLLGLSLTANAGAPVFAGDATRFTLHVADAQHRARPLLRANFDGDTLALEAALARDGSVEFVLPHLTRQRGWHVLPAVRLASVYPLGLFRAWVWVRFGPAALVYPRPMAALVPLFGLTDDDASAHHSTPPPAGGDAELSHLRDYQRGDAPRRIAWKALARNDQLLTKAFAAPPPGEVWLDWEALPDATEDIRLGWLTAAVLAAERDGRRYGLRLPGVRLAPALGDAHQAACLRALALHGLPAA